MIWPDRTSRLALETIGGAQRRKGRSCLESAPQLLSSFASTKDVRAESVAPLSDERIDAGGAQRGHPGRSSAPISSTQTGQGLILTGATGHAVPDDRGVR